MNCSNHLKRSNYLKRSNSLSQLLKPILVLRSFLILISTLLFSLPSFADPQCQNLGRLFFVGTDGIHSFWLSVAKARIEDAQLQGPVGQIVDEFSLFPSQFHLSASPFVGLGPNGVHTLYNIKNQGPCFIDSAQQTFDPPEFPGLPPDGGGGEGEFPIEPIDPNNPEGSAAGGGFRRRGGSNVLNQLVLNVNKNFLSTYLLRTYSVSERIENTFLQCDAEGWEKKWQVWVEPQYVGLSSRVATGNPRADSRNLHVGGSYNVNPCFLVGVSAVGNNSHLSSFRDSLVNKNHGILVGPYFGLNINNVILDGWLMYGYNDVKSKLLFLKGDFHSHGLMIAANASVIFDINHFMLQPKLNAFYSHSKTSRFIYSGILSTRLIGPVNVRLNVTDAKFDYARAAFTLKLFREIMLNNIILIPSLLAGVNDNFILPDHKRYVNSNLRVVTRKTWSGIAQAGIGTRMNQCLRLDFLAGYYSIGVKEDLWDLRLALTAEF